MIYVILIQLLLIKYVNLGYSFDNVKVISNKKLSNDFFGNIFSHPDIFYLNKINKAIIENNRNIPHFPEILNNYNDYIFHEIFKISDISNNSNALTLSQDNKMKIILLRDDIPQEFCDIFFEKNFKIIKILYLEENTFGILFSTQNLIIYQFSFRKSRNLMIDTQLENNNYCFLDKLYSAFPVKDFFKLSFARHIFITLDFHGKINFFNLKDYFMSRYQKFDIIKLFQLGFFDEYFFAEIGSRHRFLISGYENRLVLIRVGGRINIKKIYFFKDEIIKSIYSLDNYQILVGTNKGNLHLISAKNSKLNFDGVINICNDNVTLISQEKENFLICIKCGNNFKLIDLKGKFSEENEIIQYNEFIMILIFFLFFVIIKICGNKKTCRENNNEY